MISKRIGALFIVMTLLAALLLPAIGVSAEGQDATVTTDADTAAKLGLLLGDGDGVTAAYLGKKSTRLQAAIISLRLQGQLEKAMAYTGKTTFSDANKVGKANQPVLAYLKNHPELGWSGTGGGKFDPSAEISSKQLYKVLLEVMGFKSGTDFAYADTETFAGTKGLMQIKGSASLTNSLIATALIEALSADTAHGHTLFAMLQSEGVIAASASLPAGERIGLGKDAKLGTYFTDKNGRTLYFFTKDAADLNACQGDCLKAWPIFYSDQLQIPSSLSAADFSVMTRADGTKQTTYKGWPLYYFVKDKAAGDVLGEGVGGVWFVAKSDYAVMLGTSPTLGNYLTDDHGRTLYYFDKDTPQTSACEGNCLVNWPAYTASGTSSPTGVAGSDLGVITRTDGSKQSTYKGYPLYYFIQDKAHGDVKGQDVNHVWFVVDPAKFTGTTAPQAKTYHVDIKDYSFGTGPLTVEAGSHIVFTNYDDMQHNAVAVDGSFAVPLLAKGESYTITLNKAGTYDYYCEPHKKFMTGQIIVK
ncbi:cupredoxin domain-containing protein [Paenibacillus sp. sptzw28]|uniref:plastocyanin/azurin family copper-binding protein n=1 Tax=Paenibacillus sp. sptzw28 TaxID=715179 RepID=UPI001C6E01AA|nr:plastocyanin/azurin family copper-binding protein [Paenibacillus sp. sptzw28]QYR21917.1 cupredoxin domain-containing protein [Paenibacillus sp. sptzw28]